MFFCFQKEYYNMSKRSSTFRIIIIILLKSMKYMEYIVY